MIKNILFDFDGVILDSMPIREFGFSEIFKKYQKEDVEKLLVFHNQNGGWSRFLKIRHFYENILKKEISDNEVQKYTEKFSQIMKKELVNKKYLILETIQFLEWAESKYNLHIVSGSEHNELNYLCEKLGVDKYFKTINGSPTKKGVLVKDILENFNYLKSETILIGDSINDFQASQENNIKFYGFNNLELQRFAYISDFQEFQKKLES